MYNLSSLANCKVFRSAPLADWFQSISLEPMKIGHSNVDVLCHGIFGERSGPENLG